MGVVCSAAPQCASVGGGPQMRFSLCIVLHNSGRELGALLDSVDAHLSVRPQIICVDSGSTDDGAALARSRGADVVERGEPRGVVTEPLDFRRQRLEHTLVVEHGE